MAGKPMTASGNFNKTLMMLRKKDSASTQTPADNDAPPDKPGWFARNEARLKIGLAVLGVAIGLHEYWRAQLDTRIARSLALQERYQSGDTMDARFALHEVLNSSEAWQALTAGHNKDGRLTYGPATDVVANMALNDPKAREGLYRGWSVLKEASLCMSQRQCDQYTICKAFWADAYNTYNLFSPYFEQKNIAWDETVQDPEGYGYRQLKAFCDNERLLCLFENGGAWSGAQKYWFQTFNIRVRDNGRKCTPVNATAPYP